MNCLLDTHVWLWSHLEPERISRRATAVLVSSEHELFLSPISIWETLVLARRGRIELSPDPIRWVRTALASSPATMAEITHEVALRSEDLAGFKPRDPADRFLVATCLLHEMTLITADRTLRRYKAIQTIW